MDTANPAANSNRSLIVDDEVGITSVIEHAARTLGFQVLSIHDSDQFEKAFTKIQPDVIFLDIAMPGRDGMQLIGHLAAGGYKGQIVIMRGSGPPYIQMSAASAKTRGFAIAGVLPKPFRKQQVVELLSTITETPAA
jgi:DNA-binding NtrC family response regulator